MVTEEEHVVCGRTVTISSCSKVLKTVLRNITNFNDSNKIMLSPDRLRKDEYEKQYWGFSTTDMIEDFKEVVRNVIQSPLIELKQQIRDNGGSEDKLDDDINQLYSLYMESAKISLQNFEAKVREIFAIPDNVLLSEDQLISGENSDEEVNKLLNDVAELEKQLIREKVFLAKCEQMKKTFETEIEPLYEKVNHIISMEKMKNSESKDSPNKLINLLNRKVIQLIGNTHDSKNKAISRLNHIESKFWDASNYPTEDDGQELHKKVSSDTGGSKEVIKVKSDEELADKKQGEATKVNLPVSKSKKNPLKEVTDEDKKEIKE